MSFDKVAIPSWPTFRGNPVKWHPAQTTEEEASEDEDSDDDDDDEDEDEDEEVSKCVAGDTTKQDNSPKKRKSHK